MPINLDHFISFFPTEWKQHVVDSPWDIAGNMAAIVSRIIAGLNAEEYLVADGIAIHHTARIEEGAIIKGPAVINKDCFIAAHAYIREGVYMGAHVSVGPGCEIKSSLILSNSSLAHFNFVGDSLLGMGVNLEAGAVIANHYNERMDKKITARWKGEIYDTGLTKFGALVGDGCRIGANAVLSPGTLLEKNSIVARLQLVEQNPPNQH